MRKLAIAILGLAAFACTSRAQQKEPIFPFEIAVTYLVIPQQSGTTYNSEFVNANVGSPGFATFVFAEPNPPSQTGSTQVAFQCEFHRVKFILNAGVSGQQAEAMITGINCTDTPGTQDGFRTQTFTLNGTPLSESLTMIYKDTGNKFQLNLTINSATWTVVNPGAHQTVSGSAQIAY